MIRPQIKKQKKAENYRDSLKKGDKIVTIGGIHGKISDVSKNTFNIIPTSFLSSPIFPCNQCPT